MPHAIIYTRIFFERHSAVCLSSIALFIFFLSFGYGLNKKMDGVFTTPLDTRAQQMASAISDTAYNLDLRHAVHNKIYHTLLKGGMSDVPSNYEPIGLTAPPYKDTELWNKLILKATTLEGISKPSIADGTLSFVYAEDLGLIDFYKFSFRFFGFNIEGFYKTYFLLMGISLLLLFCGFWKRPSLLLLANILLFGIFLSICSIDNPDYSVSTVSNGRFLNSLVIIPAFHLTALLWMRPKFNGISLVATLFQSIFLGCIISMRGVGIWAVLVLSLSVLILIIKIRSDWDILTMKQFFRFITTWPIVVIFSGLLLTNVYFKSNIHPAYTTMDELLPEHFFWHSLAYGIGIGNPDYLIPEINGKRGDELGTAMGNEYLKRIIGFEHPNPSIYYASSLFPTWGRVRSYERVVKAAVLDFVFKHPFYMTRLVLITKPKIIVQMHFIAFKQTVSRNFGYVGMLAILFVALFLIFPWSQSNDTDYKLGIKVVGGLTAASLLPSIIAYPSFISSSDLFSLASSLLISSCLAYIWKFR